MQKQIFLSFFVLISLCSIKPVQAQYGHVDHWETAIYASEVWKYHVGLTPPDSNWNGRFFVDTAWASGKGGIGYGDGDDSTVIPKTTSLYMRKVFTVLDTATIHAAVVSADYDDALVVYLNGFEITREGIGKPWHEPKYTDTADYEREAQLYQHGKYDDFVIHPNAITNFLRNGDNVLAVQVHNIDSNSSDMSAWINLHFGMKDKTQQFKWFIRPPLFSPTTILPIVKLYCDTTINDSVKIPGTMQVIFYGKNKIHDFGASPNHYDGRISIKYRGNSTLQFPKKSFRLETQTSLGENLNVPLLGLPTENDWVLNGPYMDKSLIRNQLSYKIAYKTDAYGVLTQPCEVFFNDYYIGVYYLMEKIKRDDHRVDIKKLNPQDTTGKELTGGYIIKRDWTFGLKKDEFFMIQHQKPYHDYVQNEFIYYEPSADAIQPQQKEYISSFFKEFEEMLLSDHFDDPLIGYNKYIDISTFADYMFTRELAKELDSYRYSVYMYKDHIDDGGKLNMGPTWDFNIGYGNINYGSERSELPRGWMFNQGGSRMFWFERLMDDPKFANITQCRWEYHRAHIMSDESINRIIDNSVAELGEAVTRSHYLWKTLGRYVWPNYFVGDTYQEEIDYLRNWVLERVHWMDINMPGDCDMEDLSAYEIEKQGIPELLMYPNPSSGEVTFETKRNIVSIDVMSIDGRMLQSNSQLWTGTYSINCTNFQPGMYLVNLRTDLGEVISRRLVIQ